MIARVTTFEEQKTTHAATGNGERALMRAVLEDATRCLAGDIGALRERPQLAAEARRWVEMVDMHWPFSFENVCDSLGFDPGSLRRRLLRDAPDLPTAADDPGPAHTGRPRRPVPAEGEIVRMIREGHPLRVVAEAFGISISKASILSCGLASRIKAERDERIREFRRDGWTHRALAKHFGLSRIRVMRICARPQREESRRSAA
jgi:hypothetical protein